MNKADQEKALQLLSELASNDCSYYTSEPCGNTPMRKDGRVWCYKCEARAFLKRVKPR